MYTSAINYKSASQLNTAMAGVYKHMTLAVLTSMIVSYLVSTSQSLMIFLFNTSLMWVVIFAPLVAVFAIGFSLHRVSKPVALLLLHGFAALMGLSMATIFTVYTMSSIVSAFMGAVVLFGTMSFYGYFTRKSLDSWGQWLFIGLIAIVLASIINVFMQNSVAQIIISIAAIVIFTLLTAFDTQKIREQLSISSDNNVEVSGALNLYLNFINIFISLLQLFGNKNE